MTPGRIRVRTPFRTAATVRGGEPTMPLSCSGGVVSSIVRSLVDSSLVMSTWLVVSVKYQVVSSK